MAEEAIGVFDSGVGGLTVLDRIAERLPRESLVYFGDTARVPYGVKSAETVVRYAKGCANVLLRYRVKLIVAACNTASAFALDALHAAAPVPVTGVIEPGAEAAARYSRSGRIGVIGTIGTVSSAAYPRAIHERAPDAEVYCRACPLFVPLVEEGWTHGAVPRMVAEEYLAPFKAEAVDTLVLGCTHYPLLAPVIAETLGPEVRLVDSAEETARAVEELLDQTGCRAANGAPPTRRFLSSDSPDAFRRTGEKILGRAIGEVEWVDY